MAVVEKRGFIKYKDANGNVYLLYPITTMDCVDGLEEALGAMVNITTSYDAESNTVTFE